MTLIRQHMVTCGLLPLVIAAWASCTSSDSSDPDTSSSNTTMNPSRDAGGQELDTEGMVSTEDTEADMTAPEPIVWANGWEEGDALYPGMEQFLGDTWGLEALRRWPSTEFMVRIQQEQPEKFGRQFERYGLIYDPMDDLPVGLKRGSQDPDWVDESCAACHTQVSTEPVGRQRSVLQANNVRQTKPVYG
ncbi:MAG: hypothetical protein AAFX99_24905, partial [Myxococcota bacterium]